MADTPIIAYDNLLSGSSYAMIAGTDDSAAPLSDAWSWDMSRPALPLADATGKLSFRVTTSSGVGYGVDAYGAFVSYGSILPYGGIPTADVMILGAARNNPSGERFQGGHLQVLADGVEVFAQTIYEPQNASVIYQLTSHAAPTQYTITITGLTPNATVRLPELYIGASLRMPRLDYGLDFYPETYPSTSFKASSGREVRSRRFVRVEDNLKWSHLDGATINEVRQFVEVALEELQPFWFVAFPDSSPTACYLGIHAGDRANMPLGAAMRVTSFKLKFQEKL